MRLSEQQNALVVAALQAGGKVSLKPADRGNPGALEKVVKALERVQLRFKRTTRNSLRVVIDRTTGTSTQYTTQIEDQLEKDSDLKDFLAQKVLEHLKSQIQRLPSSGTIFLDGGVQSRQFFVAFQSWFTELPQQSRPRKLTIVTTNPLIASDCLRLDPLPGVEIIVVGGHLLFDEVAYVVPTTVTPIFDRPFDIAVLGTSRVNTNGTLGLPADPLLDQKIAIILSSGHIVVPVTSHKLVEECAFPSFDVFPSTALINFENRARQAGITTPTRCELTESSTIGRILQSHPSRRVSLLLASTASEFQKDELCRTFYIKVASQTLFDPKLASRFFFEGWQYSADDIVRWDQLYERPSTEEAQKVGIADTAAA